MENIKVEKTKTPKQKPDVSKVPFGTAFSDHMFIMDYDKAKGWYDARIIPFGPLCLSPAATVFHYGMEVFEGMKAYRAPDGRVQLFRPQDNISRLNNSAERVCLPKVDEAFMLDALKQFIYLEQDWVPSQPYTSLYIRPFMMAVDADLAVHGTKHCMLVVIASPVGNYYSGGLSPVGIMIEDEDVRAVRGGTGYAKCGGNYAAAMRAGDRAEEKGYSQVLWLDGVERKYVEEVGSMNVMFMLGDKVVTPKLTGSVLPGITRKSYIRLMESWGVPVEERLLSVDELLESAQNGNLKEAWGCGTAAVVSPIGGLAYAGKEYTVGGGKIGSMTKRLFDTLTDIQWGRSPDTFGWMVPVE